jgi:GT2 family glycosyltransferase
MIRRRVFEQIGMYDPSLWVAEDYDLWRRFLKQGLKFRYWPNSFYIRRQREDAWSKTVTPEKAAMHFSVLQKYVETFEPNELFPEVSWERFTGDVRKFLFHSKVCGVFLGLGEQYKTAGSSACLIQLAHEEAVRHLEICRSICPEQPAIASLEQRCRALLAESGFPGVLEGAGAGGCAPVA